MLKLGRLRTKSCERLKHFCSSSSQNKNFVRSIISQPAGSTNDAKPRVFSSFSSHDVSKHVRFRSDFNIHSNHHMLLPISCPKLTFTNRLLKNPLFQKHCALLGLNQNAIDVRYFSTSPPKDTKSASEKEKEDEGGIEVDRQLRILKQELETGEREIERAEAEKKSALEYKKTPLKTRAWKELVHYYHGFRLFFIDLKVSIRLIYQVVTGRTLSRAEKLQLVRSTADLMRLVPFLVFVIVPFMEFLLPVYLKLFPGALPSTFQERSKEEEKVRRQLKLKMEMAKFLQDTVSELSNERKKKDAADTKIAEFSKFLQNVRVGDGYVSNTQLLKYSKLFEDELTLDNLSEAQLRALCRIVGITPLGTANILRFQLSMKLNELKRDDRMIHKEGVENMSIGDLQAACRARGMRALGVVEERLRQQLQQWIELSFNEKVPPSLLLLSRTLFLPEDVPFNDRMKTLMSTLPAHLADEAKLKIAELEGASELDYKSKFQLVKSIEEILKREKDNRKAMRKAALKMEQQQQIDSVKNEKSTTTATVESSSVDSSLQQQQQKVTSSKAKSPEQHEQAQTSIGDNMNNNGLAMQAKEKKNNQL